jgi:DHA1 family bicyclomycin/chloramphenicol resistance-like MFS transporter
VLAVWSIRLPETLKPEYRLPLRWDRLLAAARTVLTTRITLGYTLAMVFAFGAFLSYLASSEIIFSDVFDLEDAFPFIFGGVAALMGAAMLLNSRIVEKVGPRRLVHTVQVGYVTAAGGLLVLALATGGTPPFWVFLAFLATMLVCHALLLPNINAVAMDPVGAVAGTASALIGTISTAGGAVLGLLLDRAFDGTVLPHAVGFLIYGAIGLGIVAVTERGRLFVDREAQVTA